MPGKLQAERTVIPAENGFPITPNDSVDLATPAKGIYVGTFGDLKVRMLGGGIVTFVGITAGIIHPIQVAKVFATGTNAQDIVGLR